MKDIFHDTIFVSKLIHYAGKRINMLKPIRWQVKRMRRQSGFLADKDKHWYEERLNHATVEVKDIDAAKTLQDADLAMNGKIEVVGGFVDVSGKIDWHTDFKNGYIWPQGLHFSKYQIISPQGGRDVKTVWDLSRCHHLLWLASAYRETGDEKYPKKIVDTIIDWIDENPYSKSINWVCPMDVAIRAVNWIFAVQMAIKAEAINVVFLRKLFESLYQHAAFVYANLEKSDPFSENHYASDITGLLFIGYLFDNVKQGRVWLDYSLQSMLYEIRTQILPSGVHFERSISYHRLVTELFFYSYLIIKKNTPTIIAIDVTYRLQTMINFIASYTKPSGYSPLFADNDNGRLLPFVKREYGCHFYLIDLAKAYGIYDNRPVRDLFDDAGFAFLRNENYFFLFSNTPTSRYSRPWRKGSIGTHTHLDALSFELSKHGKDFIVDAGAYTYTESKEIRKEFRSMRKHNTLTVDDDDPYLLNEDFGISTLKGSPYVEPVPIIMGVDGGVKTLNGSFLWKNKDVLHHRQVRMNDDGVVLTDTVETNSEHDFYFNFHLNAGVGVSAKTATTMILSMGEVSMNLGFETIEPFDVIVVNDTISPAYGVLLNSKTIVVHVKTDKQFLLTSKFQ